MRQFHSFLINLQSTHHRTWSSPHWPQESANVHVKSLSGLVWPWPINCYESGFSSLGPPSISKLKPLGHSIIWHHLQFFTIIEPSLTIGLSLKRIYNISWFIKLIRYSKKFLKKSHIKLFPYRDLLEWDSLEIREASSWGLLKEIVNCSKQKVPSFYGSLSSITQATVRLTIKYLNFS